MKKKVFGIPVVVTLLCIAVSSFASMPLVSISAYPAAVLPGGSATLTWSASNATSCSIEPGIGDVDISGSCTVSVREPTLYTITARGPGGTAIESVEIEIIPAVSLKCSNARTGGPARLSWNAGNSELCYIQPADPALGPEHEPGKGSLVSPQGTALIYPSGTTTYTITAADTDPPGQDTETVYVTSPIIDSHAKLLIHSDDVDGSTTITDLKGHPIYRYGNVHHSTAKARYGCSSIYFDGEGDCLRIPCSSDFDFIGSLNSPGAFNYTIDLWFRSDESSSERCLMSRSDKHYPYGFEIRAFYAPYNFSLIFTQYGVGFSKSIKWPLPHDEMVHLAVERTGLYRLDSTRMQCQWRFYVNGQCIHQICAWTCSYYSYGNRDLRIGVDQDGGNYFKGYIDEIRISKGIARSQDPLDLLYRIGSDCFLPPESPYYHPLVSLKSAPRVLTKGQFVRAGKVVDQCCLEHY
ncbi:MAG: LamG domain-containing protein [Syntrophales bacterium]|nr:LamG domain-containing protein [Syntrophales bacterium]